MEYLQVFDDNKKALNEKVSRANKFDLPDGKYFMVVLIFIENSKGEFLLQKTSKSRNSIIATTGGHVTYGDNAIETVIKECQEELGLSINSNDFSYVCTEKYNDGYLETFYMKKDLDINSLVLQKEEVEYVRWFTKEEIDNLILNNEFREGNIEPYKKVIDYIKGK